ncbi:MAG: class III bacteriocin [Lachnospiraceae bacterium]|nr:class III bacteriocin [Lachnospiraceae bacterium]
MRKLLILFLNFSMILGIISNAYATELLVNDSLDTMSDNGVPGLLDRDDFENEDDYWDYIEEHPEADEGLSRNDSIMDADGATPIESNATFRYKFSGLPSNYPVQKVYVGSTYIYALQRCGNTQSKNPDDTLARCEINGETATCIDYMTLYNFGHGQTLDWMEHNGNAYFIVGCKSNTENDSRWSLQVGRVQYDAGGSVSYTDIPRLSNINRANSTGTAYGDTKRVDAALSSDKSKLIIRMKNTVNEIQYTVYNMNTLNSLFDSKERQSAKYVECTNSTVKGACLAFFRQTTSSTKVQPNNSFQGIELADGGSIYISGGNPGEPPRIAKMTGSGSSYNYTYRMTIKHAYFNNNSEKGTEIEGLQLKGDYVYFSVHDTYAGSNAPAKDCIYSVNKSDFSMNNTH